MNEMDFILREAMDGPGRMPQTARMYFSVPNFVFNQKAISSPNRSPSEAK